MGRIADNYILVPENSATAINMDIDVMVRETIIYLYDVMNASNTELLNKYDDYYLSLPKDKGITIDKDEPGAANIFYPIYYNTCSTINFMLTTFITMIKPIEKALQLPKILTNPKKLAKTVNDIIQLIIKLINDITKFLTDTKNWFIEKMLGPFAKIKLPKEIGDLYSTFITHVDDIIAEILKLFTGDASSKSSNKNMFDTLISSIEKKISELSSELSKLNTNYFNKSLRRRNEVITKFIKTFNESDKLTLDNKWLFAIKNVKEFSDAKKEFINNRWNLAITDEKEILTDVKNNYNLEKKELNATAKTDSNYSTQKTEVDKAYQQQKGWDDNINYMKKVEYKSINSKLYRLVKERQKILDYYSEKKSFYEKILEDLKQKLKEAKAKLAEFLAGKQHKSVEFPNTTDIKTQVITSYIKAIIQAIIFPFKIIVSIFKSLVEAITGFLKNIPNLSKMLEGVKKLVNNLKDLTNPTKVLEFLKNMLSTVFETLKPGLGAVLDWMKNNGGISKSNLKKTLAWVNINKPDLYQFCCDNLGLIVNIIGLIPLMIKVIIEAYMNYTLQVIPAPVKSAIGF